MNEEAKQPRSWISFRVKPDEYETIYRHFRNSTCRKLSEYARKVLLNKPVTIRFRNQSADDFLQAILEIKKELNAIGHNYNQVVKKLHSLDRDSDLQDWLAGHDYSFSIFLRLKDELLLKVDQIHSKWLSE